MAFRAAITETIVFPDPTSPCNNLNIFCFDSISLFIFFNEVIWSVVSLNFKLLISLFIISFAIADDHIKMVEGTFVANNGEVRLITKIKGNEYFNVRYQIKPFMIWIWISVFLISAAGILGLFKRKYEN